MKRVRQHIIEGKSRKAFANIIPDQWAANDFTSDYGKDIQLEIFKDFESTGNIFVCQLKGSDQEIKNEKISVVMDVTHLEYFSTLHLPMLLVFYSVKTEEFWAIWANVLIDTLKLKEGQKTSTITLGKMNKIGLTFFEDMPNTFELRLPKKINISFQGTSVYKTIVERKIMLWMQKFYRGYFEIDNFFLPRKLCFALDDKDNEFIIQMTRLHDNYILRSPLEDRELSSFFRTVTDQGDLSSLESELLFLLAMTFKEYSIQKSLQLLSYCLHWYQGDYKGFTLLFSLSIEGVEANCITELQKLISLSILYCNFLDFEALNFGLFKSDENESEIRELYQQNLEKAIDSIEDDYRKGILCYNLGNYYRGSGDMYQASICYQSARKLRKEYLNEYYWWHEYAGILAQTGHFFCAERFYKKSIDLDIQGESIPFTFALLADVQFRSRRFGESLKSLDTYFKDVGGMEKIPHMAYSFQQKVIEFFIDEGYDNQVIGALLSEGPAKEQQTTVNGQDRRYLDPLDLEQLYKYANELVDVGNEDDAYFYFLAIAIIDETNPYGWIRCLFRAINEKSLELAFMLLTAMIQNFGPRILNDISDEILHWDLTKENKTNILDMFIHWTNTINDKLLPIWYRPASKVARIKLPNSN